MLCLYLWTLCFVFVFGENVNQINNTVVVETSLGMIRGIAEKTIFLNNPFYSFKGIPYATAPLKKLRFLPPVRHAHWDGIRDAFSYGSECPQIDILHDGKTNGKETSGDEGCLFLNVYTPALPRSDDFTPKSVVVYIHGGGYIIGNSDDTRLGPDFILEHDVVLVTFNYRLGALGFLSLENEYVSGNAGLKDQVAALRWVNQNIESFGGDATSITITGNSAGSASVHFLMTSPLAQGLFHRVIMQSGTVPNGWSLATHSSREQAFRLGSLLGTDTNDVAELLKALQDAPAYRLVQLSGASFPDQSHLSKPYLLPFSPTVEKRSDSAFLREDPVNMLRNGEYNHTPMLIGYTSQETIWFFKPEVIDQDVVEWMKPDGNPKIDMPERNLQMPFDSNLYKHVIQRIKKEYFKDLQDPEDIKVQIENIHSDIMFLQGIDLAAKWNSRLSPTYYYQFSFDGLFNIFKKEVDSSSKGASHCDELCYLFVCKELKKEYMNLTKDHKEYKLIRKITKLWTNFAKTGNPTFEMDEELDYVQWMPTSVENEQILDINEKLALLSKPLYEKFTFWNDLIDYIKTEKYLQKINKVEL